MSGGSFSPSGASAAGAAGFSSPCEGASARFRMDLPRSTTLPKPSVTAWAIRRLNTRRVSGSTSFRLPTMVRRLRSFSPVRSLKRVAFVASTIWNRASTKAPRCSGVLCSSHSCSVSRTTSAI